MKNYFNKEEQCNHFIAIVSTVMLDNLINGQGATAKEKQMLKTAKTYINNFTQSVFQRLGEGYRRSIMNKAKDNTICVTAKNLSGKSPIRPTEDKLDHEEIVELLNLCSSLNCQGCERTDCLNCQIYKMKTHLNYDGKSEDNDLCPFREEIKVLEEIDF